MQYQLSDVYFNDIDKLVRYCEFPAMEQNPLQRIMFPNANPSPEEKEEQIKWTVEGLQESSENQSSYFHKVTVVGSDCFAGFAVWTLESKGEGTTQKVAHKRNMSWIPASLDIKALNQVSQRLREERMKVLHDQQTVCSRFAKLLCLISLTSYD